MVAPTATEPVVDPPAWRWRRSLAGRLSLAVFAGVTAAAAGAAAVAPLGLAPGVVLLAGLAAGLPVALWLVGRTLRPIEEHVQALADGVASLRDGDFSLRLAELRDDEIGRLVHLYNATVDVLREERSAIRQRELLLETALQRSPLAIVLANPAGRIVYANAEAARLFLGGGKLEGRRFDEVLAGCPPELRAVLETGTDGLFTVDSRADGEVEPETFHLAQRRFHLDRVAHRLYLLRRLTAEISREEVRIWKKVIRVISHEINNSLAPISSLVHSATVVAGRRDAAGGPRLEEIFAGIRERIAHLGDFLESYARFARLPPPEPRAAAWADLLAAVAPLYPFAVDGAPAPEVGFFDPGQMEQVLINLVKNAREASGEDGEVTVRVAPAPDGGTLLQVLDRGPGLSAEAMRQAVLPFYSTKKTGLGVGLPLCREILAAHGGRLQLQERPGGGLVVTGYLPPAAIAAGLESRR